MRLRSLELRIGIGQIPEISGHDRPEKPRLECEITRLETIVSSLEALLAEAERLKWQFVFRQATIVVLEAQGVHLTHSERVQTGLEKGLSILAEGGKSLQNLRGIHRRELSLSKAVHDGEAGCSQAWKEREALDERTVLVCLAPFKVSLQTVDKLCKDIIQMME